MTLQGRFHTNEETGVLQFYGAEDRNTLSKTPQPVPGGLLGITLITSKGGKLVNNEFSAPGVNGCGGPIIEYLLDPLVNSILGVPAGSGANTAVLEGVLQTADAEAVRASE